MHQAGGTIDGYCLIFDGAQTYGGGGVWSGVLYDMQLIIITVLWFLLASGDRDDEGNLVADVESYISYFKYSTSCIIDSLHAVCKLHAMHFRAAQLIDSGNKWI